MEGVLPTLGSRPLALEAGLAQARGGRGGLPVTSPQETGRLAQGEPGEGSVLKHLLPWPRSLGRVGTSPWEGGPRAWEDGAFVPFPLLAQP